MKFARDAFIVLVLTLASCTAPSYLPHRVPGDLILRKQTSGGAAAMTGTELMCPSFSLYADGRVIQYGSIEGRRALLTYRLKKDDFFEIYHNATRLLSRRDGPPTIVEPTLPTTMFRLDSSSQSFTGLGFAGGNPFLDSVARFSRDLDRIQPKSVRVFVADSIVLFVKKLSTGDADRWPIWPFAEIDLEAIYRKPLSFYEANEEQNSVIIRGKTAKAIQRRLTQASVYEKFGFGSAVYAAGYRPLLP